MTEMQFVEDKVKLAESHDGFKCSHCNDYHDTVSMRVGIIGLASYHLIFLCEDCLRKALDLLKKKTHNIDNI